MVLRPLRPVRAMSVQTECKRRELALKSYAEVQPVFAGGNGISAQGKVNGVNDTLRTPMTRV